MYNNCVCVYIYVICIYSVKNKPFLAKNLLSDKNMCIYILTGIDAWLTVYSSGMQMQYVADPNTVTWFPIQTLHVCAAVKCVIVVNGATGERVSKFVSLDSQSSADSHHPPMFASIMRRTKGVKVRTKGQGSSPGGLL